MKPIVAIILIFGLLWWIDQSDRGDCYPEWENCEFDQ